MQLQESVIDAQELELIEKSLEEIEFFKVLTDVSKHCMTSLGVDEVLGLRPIQDVDLLRKEHAQIEELRSHCISGETFPIERTEDISSSLQTSMISMAYLKPTEVLTILDVMQVSRRVASYILQRDSEFSVLQTLCEGIFENRILEKHITECIDETGNIRDNASKDLQKIRSDIHETTAKLRNRITRILSKLGEDDLLQEEYISQRDGRFVIPIKVENKRAVPGLIHGVSSSGATVFVEPSETFELNNELSLLHHEEHKEIVKILTTLTGEIGSFNREIRSSLSVLTTIDTLHARAQWAIEQDAIKPNIVQHDFLELRRAFHPILVKSNPKSKVIPLNIEFNSETQGFLISGPNAGGKSVAMKSIGLNIALALSGIFPIAECTCNPRRIFTAIGDHQSIESNLSTFSSQITRLKEILSFAGKDSLILVDEICAGTDPTEGSALAAGILDSIIERGSFFVVTTHQSSLKSYAISKEKISNASLEFDQEKLLPTYTFLPGVPGNSYAFALAESVGLPEVVINRSKTYLGDRHSELEQSIAVMQTYRREAEKKALEVYQRLNEAEQKKKEYENRFNQFKEKYQKLMQAANEEASSIVKKAQSTVELTIKELKEQSKSASEAKQSIESLRKEFAETAAKLAPKKTSTQTGQLNIGDSVALKDSNQIGVLQAIDGNTATIDFNGITFKTPISNLERTNKTSIPFGRSARQNTPFRLDAASTLDIRGERAAIAIPKIDEHLNNALISNVPFVSIIHGKGTGALRNAVHEFLRDHPSVKSYRLGELGEGDSGVTIVDL